MLNESTCKCFGFEFSSVVSDKEEKRLPTPLIFSIPGGGFVVANCTNLSDINVSRYDEQSNKVSFISLEKAGAFGDFSLACTKDNAFIVLPSIPVSRPYTMKVKVIAIGF